MLKPIIVSTGQRQFCIEAKLFKLGFDNYIRGPEVEGITILSPTYGLTQEVFPGLKHLQFDIGPENSDKFFAKLVITEYLKQGMASDSCILYLDTDHIFRKQLTLPQLHRNEIYVSSEVKDLSLVLGQEITIYLKDNYPFLKSASLHHYNTSLIYGKYETLLGVSSGWWRIYHELFNYIPHCLLEEVSFSIAVMERNIELKPCPSSFQGSFYHPDESCCLFHYGGAYPESKLIKNSMQNEELDQTLHLIEGIIRRAGVKN